MTETLQTLKRLFDERRYQAMLDLAEQQSISPASDPVQAQALASALFQLGRFDDCCRWCDELVPALGGQPDFASMHGAALRRLGRLDEAAAVFAAALELHPDHPLLRNNHANLLIDLGRFSEAEAILRALLAELPSYADAAANLQRLDVQRNLAARPVQPRSDLLQDPLLAAFTEDEVKLAGGRPAAGADPLLQSLPERQAPQELQELLRLARSLVNADPQAAIAECRQLQRRIGCEAAIYAIAGEAYIALQLFADAETALLTALALGTREGSVLLNLANLASMRGDHQLAQTWINRLAADQPDFPQLNAVREALFPAGQPFPKGDPFQVVLAQKVPGAFQPVAAAS